MPPIRASAARKRVVEIRSGQLGDKGDGLRVPSQKSLSDRPLEMRELDRETGDG